MQELSDYQRRVLLKNPNVEKITEKHIVFTAKFKVKAIELFLKGVSSNEIFRRANINIEYFKKDYTRYCLKKWKKKFESEGKESFLVETRGKNSIGRPKNTNVDDLNVEELRAIVEIQQELIETLKKNRALAKKKRK